MDHQLLYYSSHAKLPFITSTGQRQLEHSKVLVIGAGGLGCPCLLALAGAGIGTIGIADFDIISISNLHRQPLYNFTDVGKLKTTVAAERLQQYNPFIKIIPHSVSVDESNIIPLLSSYDLVVDCTDNFSTRYLVNDTGVYLNKPLVYGAIHQGEGHITVFNYNNSPTLRCLFPNDENDGIASCAEIGAYNITTAIIGNMMANEVIKIILQQPDVLAGKLRQVNVLDGSSIIVGYAASAEGRTKSLQRFSAEKTSNEISAIAVAQKINQQQVFFLLDVREPAEHEAVNIGGSNIPLQTLLQTTHFPFSASDEIIVYCEKGNRSRMAVEYLKQKGFSRSVSMQGGIESYLRISTQ